MPSNEPVVLVLSEEEAFNVLSSFGSADRGREDFEYLVSQDRGDYSPADVAATRKVHQDEVATESKVAALIKAQSLPVRYLLTSLNSSDRYGEYPTPEAAADALVTYRERTPAVFDESWKVTPTHVPTARPRVYLDLITSTLPQAEMHNITAAPPTVRDHEYGAWVHVHPADADWDEDLLNPATNEDWEQFPVLNKVLLAARELGANWVNFDADGHDTLVGFPTYDW